MASGAALVFKGQEPFPAGSGRRDLGVVLWGALGGLPGADPSTGSG
jgi:hypothetical protein